MNSKKEKKCVSLIQCPTCGFLLFENVTGFSPEDVKCHLDSSLNHPCPKRISARLGTKRKNEELVETVTENVQSSLTVEITEAMAKGLEKFSDFVGDFPCDENLRLPPELKEAAINRDSLVRLYPGRFLNDHIINFYCIYLSHIKFADLPVNFIIYSTFFYESLQKIFASNNKFDIKRVQRQRSVNMFEKSFVIFPLHLHGIHWITFVICHPCQIKYHLSVLDSSSCDNGKSGQSTEPTEAVYSVRSLVAKIMPNHKMPCMLIFDSLENQDQTVFQNIRRYLTEEYKRFYNIDVNFNSLPGYYVPCPQQQNTFDCGVFTLINIEMLLENTEIFHGAPPDLQNWYGENLVFHKRAEILNLIINIVQNCKVN